MSCYLCQSPDSDQCHHCHQVNSCQDHLQHHHHHGQCLPWSVVVTSDRGRTVVTTRDIAPGELILRDSPLLVTPHTKTRPQCLQCAR